MSTMKLVKPAAVTGVWDIEILPGLVRRIIVTLDELDILNLEGRGSITITEV